MTPRKAALAMRSVNSIGSSSDRRFFLRFLVSVPTMELFRAQSEDYRREVLPAGTVRVAIEAGVRQGWDWLLMGEGGSEAKSAFIGMNHFGASAPADILYKEFGITPEKTVEKAKALL